MVEWLFLAVPQGCLQFVIVVFPDHTHLLFFIIFFNSFLPSSIREWNNLPLDLRNSHSVFIFKRKLNSDIKAIPRHFYAGNRCV